MTALTDKRKSVKAKTKKKNKMMIINPTRGHVQINLFL